MLAKFSNDTQMKVSSFHPRWSFRTKRGWKAWNGSVGMGWHSALLCLATLRYWHFTWDTNKNLVDCLLWMKNYHPLMGATTVFEQPAWWDGIKVVFFLYPVSRSWCPFMHCTMGTMGTMSKKRQCPDEGLPGDELRLDFEEEMKRIERFVNLNLDWIHWISVLCFQLSKTPQNCSRKTASLITKIRDPRCNSWPKVVSDLSPGKGASGNQRTMALVGHGFRDFVDRRKSVSYIPIWILSWRLKVRSTKTRSNDKFHHFSTSSAFLPG